MKCPHRKGHYLQRKNSSLRGRIVSPNEGAIHSQHNWSAYRKVQFPYRKKVSSQEVLIPPQEGVNPSQEDRSTERKVHFPHRKLRRPHRKSHPHTGKCISPKGSRDSKTKGTPSHRKMCSYTGRDTSPTGRNVSVW